MDRRNIEIADDDTTDKDDRSNSRNKLINWVDTELQTCDEYSQSQDLFADDESFAENSRSVDLVAVPETGKIINMNNSSVLYQDLTAVLTQTPKIGIREQSSPYPATVPSVPKSLVPFISTVNESWNSDLETPQAKTAAEPNLQRIERSEHFPKSCETMERKRCDTIRSSVVIPDVTTPNGCFIVEDERISASPILNTMSKRRRPKRRILKSLIDATNSTDSSKENENDSTFVIDENCSIHNTNIHPTQYEIFTETESTGRPAKNKTVINNVQDSTLDGNYGEECLLNQRLQGCEEFGETSDNNTLEREEGEAIIVRLARDEELAVKELGDDEYEDIRIQKKSVAELFEEIKELQKNEEQVTEYNLEDIPMEIFMRDAEALENAQMVPMIIPSNKSTVKKKQQGFVSFTEMCLLGQDNSENEDPCVEENTKPPQTIQNCEILHKIHTGKFTSAESADVSSEDDKHVGNISSLSSNERDEPAMDIDEFSPWFYQPNDVKSEVFDKSNTKENKLSKESIKSIQIESEVDEVKSIGFSTAGGKRITISEHKIKKAEKLYEEITLQDEKYYNAKIQRDVRDDHHMINKENVAEILRDSYPSMSFSTAGRKAINIREDKLKAAKKLYKEISLQDEKHKDAEVLDNRAEDCRINNIKNGATILKDPHFSMGFSTAGGKAIRISEDKLEAATKLYEEISMQDEKHHDAKVLRNKTENCRMPNKENEAAISKDSYSSMGFSTAGGKAIKISEDNLKTAKKLYEEISLQDEKCHDAEVSDNKSEDRRMNNKENKATILKDSHSLMGFSTAGGRTIRISEDKLIVAKKLYEEISLQDEEHRHVRVSGNKRGECRMDNKENEGSVLENCYSLTGISKVGGKSTSMREGTLNKAARLFDEINSTQNMQVTVDSAEISTTRGIKRRREYDDDDFPNICVTDSSVGFKTADGKSVNISETAMKKAKMMYRSIDLVENQLPQHENSTHGLMNPKKTQSTQLSSGNLIENEPQKSNNARDRNMETFGLQERSFAKQVSINQTMSEDISDSKISISTGLNSANGKSMEILNRALSKAGTWFGEEANSLEPSPSSLSNDCKEAVIGFSTAIGEWISISEDVMAKSNELFDAGLENTPPQNTVLKRNSTELESPLTQFSNVPASNAPVSKALSENISSDISQSSKKVKFNSDLQTRRLFNEADREMEFLTEIDRENNEPVRKPYPNGSSFAHHLLSHENRKNISLNRNSTAGLYAKSEMFETNDRLMMPPQLKAQKSSPTIQDDEAAQFVEKFNRDNSRLRHVQKDRRISTYSQEIEASTEALLADENSFDGKLWASAITCSPTMMEDRDISVKPITCEANCDEAAQQLPTSPIIGARYRTRKKIRRNKGNLLKKDTGCNLNGDLGEQIVARNSQQSSGVVTPNSDSSNRNINTVIDTVLVTELKKLRESSTEVQFLDNSFGRIPIDIGDEEAADCFLENHIVATLEQEKQIRAKKKCKSKPIPGNLFLRKTENKELRVSWRQAMNGAQPTPRTHQEMKCLRIRPNVMEVTAATALDYKFRCLDFYSKDEIRANTCGIGMGDGGRLIFDVNGYASVTEFEKAFLASPGVDPALVPSRWVENHYRWIVWKLACMDRVKFGDSSMPRILTPSNLMEQLKYRYDREIDRSERSALRRIIEKDDPPCSRMILCVATITKTENIEALGKSPRMTPTSSWKVELTDGWYSIMATIDSAMAHLIAFGKVREGTKLVTCRAELLNCEQGCSPLEVPCDVSLKIHTNSTRRSKWDTKLGYCRHAGPIPTLLTAVLPNGGLIGKLRTIIARVYPMQYFEKTPGGHSVFRNNKSEDKAVMMYEEERQKQIETVYAKARAEFEARNGELCRDEWNDSEPNAHEQNHRTMSEKAFQRQVESMLLESLLPPRKVTLVLKVRVMDGDNLAILTVWAPSEDIIDVLKEGNRVSIHNVQTSGKRSGELQLTAGRQSFVKPEESNVALFSQRCFTAIPEVASVGFNPPFGEFDTVGNVVSLGPAPHGMKNFEVVNLAYPNSDSSDSAYLSILFWEGIGAHGFSDILCVGATVACTNLQWRRGVYRTIPMAYCTEYSTFTQNPRQIYLRSAFDSVKKMIKDPMAYVSQCAAEIATEHQKKTNILRSPAVQSTPSKASPSAVSLQNKSAAGTSPRTPQSVMNSGVTTPAKYSIQRRLEKLHWYAEPPDLSPVALNHSSTKVNNKFVLPIRTPEKFES